MDSDYTKHVIRIYRPEATYFYNMITGVNIATALKCQPASSDTNELLAGFLMVAGKESEHWIDIKTLNFLFEKANIANSFRSIN